jgi:hypothetical protein
MCGMSRELDIAAACVPLPAPGDPIRTMRIT